MKAIWYHHFEKNKEYGYIETIGTRIQTVYITKLHIKVQDEFGNRFLNIPSTVEWWAAHAEYKRCLHHLTLLGDWEIAIKHKRKIMHLWHYCLYIINIRPGSCAGNISTFRNIFSISFNCWICVGHPETCSVILVQLLLLLKSRKFKLKVDERLDASL